MQAKSGKRAKACLPPNDINRHINLKSKNG